MFVEYLNNFLKLKFNKKREKRFQSPLGPINI